MPYIGKSPSAGVRQRYQYTATAGQTTFSGTDLGNLTLTYTDNNFVDVFQNGVLLKGGGTDYTATSGTSVVLATGASVSDVIEIIVYDVFSVGNFYNRTDSDSRFVRHDSATAGTDNFIAGNNAGDAIQSGGNYNTVIGNEAGTAITTGDRNTAVGFEALKTATTAQYNVAVGYQALENNTGNNNTAVGDQALEANTSGTNNTAVGDDALVANTTGIRNVAVGNNALDSNQEGDQSVAVGFNALQAQNPSGNADMNNTAVGNDAGYANTTGSGNTFIGAGAGVALTTGINSTFVGYLAGSGVSTGNNNTMVGQAAGQNTTGSFNNFFGGGNGTAAGYDVTSGTKNTILGGYSGNGGGLDIRTSDNYIVLSDGDGNPRFYINQNGLPYSPVSYSTTTSSGANMYIQSDGAFYRSTSSRRYKNTIKDATHGLTELLKLRSVTYKGNNDGDIIIGGLIAEEVHDAGLTEFVQYNDDNEPDSLSYGNMVSLCIKAIQELSAKNDALEARIKKLEDEQLLTKVQTLEASIKKLEDEQLLTKVETLEARIKKLEDG